MIYTEPVDVASVIELLTARGLTVLRHYKCAGLAAGLSSIDTVDNLASHVNVGQVVMAMPLDTPDEVFIEWEGRDAFNNEFLCAIKPWSPSVKGDAPFGQSLLIKVLGFMPESIEVRRDLLHHVWYVYVRSGRTLEWTVVHVADDEALAISIAQEMAFDINKLIAQYMEEERNIEVEPIS